MLNDTSFLLNGDISQDHLPLHIQIFLDKYIDKLSSQNSNTSFCLCYSNEGLSLESFETTPNKKNQLIYIDFIHGKNGYRHAHNLTIKQPLAKAVGIKPGFRPTIFDATAGLGGDGFVLACLGCQITLCERSPILHILLEDALYRASQDLKLQEIIQKQISLVSGNSIKLLQNLKVIPYTVYMDPMYPHRTKSALNKKEMRVIRDVVGDDEDSEKLLTAALSTAANRVVVKRPKGAPLVGETMPSYQVKMKNSRFDVYLT